MIYFAVGFLSHLAIDVFNKKKVRLLYPLKSGVAFEVFHAHGLANRILFILGSIVTVLEIVLFLVRIFVSALQ